MSKISIDAIDALLPQTQCQECGYQGCLPYAKAILEKNEALNKCPPGGVKTLKMLGALLEQDVSEAVETFQTRQPSVARIIEDDCIGCTKCIQACPVDAIVGSAKWMHTVIEDECTGCGLCVAPCPVDCIILETLSEPSFDPSIAKKRFQNRNQRLALRQQARQAKRHNKSEPNNTVLDEKQRKKDYIAAALKRVKDKKP